MSAGKSWGFGFWRSIWGCWLGRLVRCLVREFPQVLTLGFPRNSRWLRNPRRPILGSMAHGNPLRRPANRRNLLLPRNTLPTKVHALPTADCRHPERKTNGSRTHDTSYGSLAHKGAPILKRLESAWDRTPKAVGCSRGICKALGVSKCFGFGLLLLLCLVR
jgi:hypothetical protein